MSHAPNSAAMPPAGASVSASPSEKNASSSSNLSVPTPGGPAPKLRSCVVCRTRKVRCDKLSPCSNCRRANIACVFPSTDRPPRWARRLERVAQNAAANAQAPQEPDPAAVLVMERLRNLEGLVKELRGQLEEQAHTATSSVVGSSSDVNSPESTGQDRDIDQRGSASPNANAGNLQKQFGRLVLKDANRSRYVGSGFWSRVNDEVCQPVTSKPSSSLELLSNQPCSLMVSRLTAAVLGTTSPIAQRTKPRPGSPCPPKNLNGHLQNATHSCFDTT